MAERPPLRRSRRPWLVALVLLVIVGAVIAVAVGLAVAHLNHKRTVTTTAQVVPKPFRIVFPEGFTRAQMAQRVAVVARIADAENRGRVKISAATYLAASRQARVPCFGRAVQKNLEGFLFPATYPFYVTTTSRGLVKLQLQAFCTRWRTVGMAYARSKNLTRYDVLRLASMIEKEAVVPAERPLIAAVMYNRLHARMTLGIDATLRYGLHISPTQSILKSQLQNPTPYNTRLHQGLPPTAIANPGLASLVAAAHPAKVDYLFFVRKPDHKHDYFTSSAADFYHYECTHHIAC